MSLHGWCHIQLQSMCKVHESLSFCIGMRHEDITQTSQIPSPLFNIESIITSSYPDGIEIPFLNRLRGIEYIQ